MNGIIPLRFSANEHRTTKGAAEQRMRESILRIITNFNFFFVFLKKRKIKKENKKL